MSVGAPLWAPGAYSEEGDHKGRPYNRCERREE